jgi:glutathione synthase/RimK-type ligase-like ATP-grasp enzyme
MKKIAVFFDHPEAKKYPFNKEEYWTSYQELNQEIQNLGAQLYIVRSQNTYLGNAKFSKSWQFENNDLIETGPIIVDVLYDKGGFTSDGKVALSNTLEIDNICTDKWKTYELLEEFCPKTIVTHNDQEFESGLTAIETKKIVIKPLDQEEGHGVYIGDIEYIKSSPKEYPLLIQEFLDSSAGMPGFVDGIHDFRVALMNGEIVYSFVRTPPPGELLANIARGGTSQVIPEPNIPQEAKDLVFKIDEKMAKFGNRFYGVDMAFTPQGLRIIELNSKLGLHENNRHPIFIEFKKKLAKYLVNLT